MKITVFAKQPGNRLKYVLNELLRYSPFDEIYFVDDPTKIDSSFPLINYSNITIDLPCLHIIPCGLLTNEAIIEIPEAIHFYDGLPYFFKTGTGDKFTSYDVLSMLFYQLSCYEEYTNQQTDHLGRKLGKKSLAYRHNFLKLPVVDLWKKKFFDALGHIYSREFKMNFPFHFSFTVDVDFAWAYRHRPWHILAGGAVKELITFQFQPFITRLKFLLGIIPDPYDTYDLIETWLGSDGKHTKYFFLVGDPTAMDKNIRHDHPSLEELIRKLAEKYEVGIHPSSLAAESDEILEKEIKRLQDLDIQVENSRQHYLLLHLPDTYRSLLKSGIKNDYSMGFHDVTGYRAGTACPYEWYDIEKETATSLTVHPFYSMDVTYKNYLKLTPEEGLTDLRLQIDFLTKAGLPFCVIWHNSSMSPLMHWQNWEKIPSELIQYLKQKYN